ncbi:MAG: hypothetical protein KTM48_03705 [Wolbachia endosymbiont of Pissodes strobi]|nr:hypothetical protein [Wolbachia endosymbiont of Pissodes strobi]
MQKICFRETLSLSLSLSLFLSLTTNSFSYVCEPGKKPILDNFKSTRQVDEVRKLQLSKAFIWTKFSERDRID